ncbi:MAG: hypothetical protein K8F91_03675, partial [Candidatus Obscuribacterales bacterium]|nr:hypothetical protein [Candidatus Obscuribacterales bacterium]
VEEDKNKVPKTADKDPSPESADQQLPTISIDFFLAGSQVFFSSPSIVVVPIDEKKKVEEDKNKVPKKPGDIVKLPPDRDPNPSIRIPDAPKVPIMAPIPMADYTPEPGVLIPEIYSIQNDPGAVTEPPVEPSTVISYVVSLPGIFDAQLVPPIFDARDVPAILDPKPPEEKKVEEDKNKVPKKPGHVVKLPPDRDPNPSTKLPGGSNTTARDPRPPFAEPDPLDGLDDDETIYVSTFPDFGSTPWKGSVDAGSDYSGTVPPRRRTIDKSFFRLAMIQLTQPINDSLRDEMLKRIDLQSRIKDGKVSCQMSGDGDTLHTDLTLTNRTKAPVVVWIPAFTFFKSQTPSLQDMLKTADPVMRLAPTQVKTIKIDTFCASTKSVKPPPPERASYTVATHTRQKDLVSIIKTAERLAMQGAFDTVPINAQLRARKITQTAIWMFLGKLSAKKSDLVTVESLTEDMLSGGSVERTKLTPDQLDKVKRFSEALFSASERTVREATSKTL